MINNREYLNWFICKKDFFKHETYWRNQITKKTQNKKFIFEKLIKKEINNLIQFICSNMRIPLNINSEKYFYSLYENYANKSFIYINNPEIYNNHNKLIKLLSLFNNSNNKYSEIWNNVMLLEQDEVYKKWFITKLNNKIFL